MEDTADGPLRGLRFEWSAAPVLLPFAARCHSMVVGAETTSKHLADSPGDYLSVVLMGGQLSYTDATCQSAPITVNEVWYSTQMWPWAEWYRGLDAPWSPRQGMVRWSDFWLSLNYYRYPQFGLAGGIRYLQLRVDGGDDDPLALPSARLVSAEMFADVWLCSIHTDTMNRTACDWVPAQYVAPEWDTEIEPQRWTPAASIPVPLAYVPSPAFIYGSNVGTLFGGVTSSVALHEWQQLQDTILLDGRQYNSSNSLIVQPYLMEPEDDAPSVEDVLDSRHWMSLSYQLSEDELNDPSDCFVMGGEGLVTSSLPQQAPSAVRPGLVSVHQLRSQQFPSPNSSHVYSALPASQCANTSRAALDFVYTRYHHGAGALLLYGSAQMFTADPDDSHTPPLGLRSLLLSGGQSGSTYHNDWLLLQQEPTIARFWPQYTMQSIVSCFQPDDPSYRELLGPGHTVGDLTLTCRPMYNLGFVPCSWQCDDGYVFDPPTTSATAQLTCMPDGLWYDVELHGRRRCVPIALHCEPPLVNVDGQHCDEPQARVDSIRLVTSDSLTEYVTDCRSVTPLIVQDCLSQDMWLELVGDFFLRPLLVLVGGFECRDPQLRDIQLPSPNCSRGNDTSGCPAYAKRVICPLQGLWGQSLPVSVYSGPYMRPGPTLARIGYSPPHITSMWSADCLSNASSPVRLSGCPHDRPFNVSVWGRNLWLSSREQFPDGREPVFSMSTNRRFVLPYTKLDDSIASSPTDSEFICLFPPSTGADVPVLVALSGIGDNSDQAYQGKNGSATISYAPCLAGTFIAALLPGPDDAPVQCVPCPAGQSTVGETDALFCSRCPAGHYSEEGQAFCTACPVNTASAEGAPRCLNCSLNSYGTATGQSACNDCGLSQYLLIPAAADPLTTRSSPVCRPCIDGAYCAENGTITNTAAAYLLVYSDAEGDSVPFAAVPCRATACINDAQLCSASPTSDTPRLPRSQLPVINCCAASRQPGSSNPLCAECLDGYSEWNGECVECRSTNWLAVYGLTLLGLALLVCLHRVPRDSSRARLSILMYFLQVSFMQQAGAGLPQFSGLFDLQLFGDSSHFQWTAAKSAFTFCLAPLSAWGKVAVRALTPLGYAVGLLLIFAVQALMRRLLFAPSVSSDGVGMANDACDSRAVLTPRTPRYEWSDKLYSLLFSTRDPMDAEVQDGAPAEDGTSGEMRAARTDLASTTTKGVHSSASTPSSELQSLHHWDALSRSSSARSGLSSPLLPSASDSFWEGSESMMHPSDGVGTDRNVVVSPPRWHVCGVSVYAFHRTFLRLILYSYSGLSLLTLSLLHCQPLGGQHGSRLHAYPQIDCSSQQYRQLLPLFIVLMVGLVVSVPLAMFCFLYRRRLHFQSQPEHHFFALYGTLYGAYKPAYWYWTVVVLVRRAVLVVLIVFVDTDDFATWAVTFNVLVLTSHVVTWPFAHVADNWMETLSLMALSWQPLYVGSFTKPVPAVDEQLINIALIALPLTVMMVAGLWRSKCCPAWLHR